MTHPEACQLLDCSPAWLWVLLNRAGYQPREPLTPQLVASIMRARNRQRGKPRAHLLHSLAQEYHTTTHRIRRLCVSLGLPVPTYHANLEDLARLKGYLASHPTTRKGVKP